MESKPFHFEASCGEWSSADAGSDRKALSFESELMAVQVPAHCRFVIVRKCQQTQSFVQSKRDELEPASVDQASEDDQLLAAKLGESDVERLVRDGAREGLDFFVGNHVDDIAENGARRAPPGMPAWLRYCMTPNGVPSADDMGLMTPEEFVAWHRHKRAVYALIGSGEPAGR